IFAEDGEAAFRRLEAAAIRDLSRTAGSVIATGGGVPMSSANVAHLRRSGFVILLWSDPEEILARCGRRTNRPLLDDTDDPRARLAALYAGPLIDGLRAHSVKTQIAIVPAGERHKNLRTAARLYDSLLDAGLDRKSLLITLGGGVLGDLGGFVAATYLRGIDF